MNVTPKTTTPARVAIVSIGPPTRGRRVLPAYQVAYLERVPMVAVDFYPGRPPQACKPQEPKCP